MGVVNSDSNIKLSQGVIFIRYDQLETSFQLKKYLLRKSRFNKLGLFNMKRIQIILHIRFCRPEVTFCTTVYYLGPADNFKCQVCIVR